jgi:hypothetical protein
LWLAATAIQQPPHVVSGDAATPIWIAIATLAVALVVALIQWKQWLVERGRLGWSCSTDGSLSTPQHVNCSTNFTLKPVWNGSR